MVIDPLRRSPSEKGGRDNGENGGRYRYQDEGSGDV